MLQVLFVNLITVGHKLVARYDQLRVMRNKDQERRKWSILENAREEYHQENQSRSAKARSTLRSKMSAEKRGSSDKEPEWVSRRRKGQGGRNYEEG